MLKFFRKIRRKLLEGGNLKRYLIYAIGEILLVMIGILLALQVNNWNETQKERRAESKLLLDLQSEFGRDYKDLERVYTAKKEAYAALLDYYQKLNSDTLSLDYITSIQRPDLAGYTWNPTNPILNGLLNSGKLEFLQSDSLKYLLSAWKDMTEDYLEQQTLYQEHNIQNLVAYESKSIPIRVITGDFTMESMERVMMSKFDLLTRRAQLVNDLEYHNLLAACTNRLWIQVLNGKGVISTSNRIQSLLEKGR